MAIYTQLPVYEKTLRLLLDVVPCTMRMQRDYRYTMGEQLKRCIMDILILIFKANKTEQKDEYISIAREKLVEVQIMMRVLNELRQISDKQFVMFAEMTENVSKQLSSWERYVVSRLSQTGEVDTH
jgi:hypothetical protein